MAQSRKTYDEDGGRSSSARQLAVAVVNGRWTFSEPTPPAALYVSNVVVDGIPYVVIELDDVSPFKDVAAVGKALSPAEEAILPFVLTGRSTRDIARLRGVAERTISNQLASIFRKLGVGSRAGLVALASVPPTK